MPIPSNFSTSPPKMPSERRRKHGASIHPRNRELSYLSVQSAYCISPRTRPSAHASRSPSPCPRRGDGL
jgi:hypothetical protein